MFQGFAPYSHLNCDSSQKNSAVVIFLKEKLPQFFLLPAVRKPKVKDGSERLNGYIPVIWVPMLVVITPREMEVEYERI